ncbi:MAG: cytochrome C oxidase subunit IV family protein [Anaerolineales bacterium]|nr:cytochrome C oxidase subunit IV family protein [Anaerolineales bacterium]
MESQAAEAAHTSHRKTYTQVFVALVILTAIEVGLAFLGLPRGVVTTLFLLLSLGKAGLVAAYYMHLRDDSALYTWIFVLPVVMLIVFVIMASLY